MAQIFHPSANTVSRVSVFGSLFFVGALLYTGYVLVRSPYQTKVRVIQDQPIQFSHAHHVSQLGIDCRYCHTNVETQANPGMPPTETCMSCHSQIWTQSPLLEPVRASWRDNKPIEWVKLHDLPDFVYFHHGVHVSKGVSCVTCHGDVSQMPLAFKDQPMTMEWCLECHRNPEPRIGPKDQVFAPEALITKDYKPSTGPAPTHLDAHYSGMTNCSTCHH